MYCNISKRINSGKNPVVFKSSVAIIKTKLENKKALDFVPLKGRDDMSMTEG